MESVTVIQENPLVSVVMINWNRKETVRQVLNRMLCQTYPSYEIIMVDNGSDDGSADMVEREFPQVRLIRLMENAGIKGYNIALQNASGEFIIIIDSDSFLEDEGITKIVRKFQQYPKLGALGCKVYYYPSGKVHYWHPTVRDDDHLGRGFHSPLFNGCAAAARMNVLKEVGFYPEEFFLYENERDLCTRILNADYDVKYFTDITAFHMVSAEKDKSERLVFYATRNLIWYFWKYIPVSLALYKTICLVVLAVISGLRTGKIRTYLRSVCAAIIGLPVIVKHRTPVKRKYLSKVLY